MAKITARDLPPGSLIAHYRDAGHYADCFAVTVPHPVSQAAYIEAFYTSWLFKLERLVLALLVAKPSTDAQAHDLAQGRRDAFAAWTLEARAPDQIVLCDYQNLTRSWLMTEPAGEATILHFGTAVVARGRGRRTERTFKLLTPVHRLYARALLGAAAAKIRR